MASNDTTLDKLRFLETLYHHGYQSDVIDRSLDKMIALELAKARRELTELQARLEIFEQQYQMSSDRH